MYLYPSDGGLIRPMSTQITEKEVPINGNFLIGASANSQYVRNVGSAICLVFSSSGPMSNDGMDWTLSCFGGLLSVATIALV